MIQEVTHIPQTSLSRIALGVEYRGTKYHGFQRQSSGVPSVQEALERAISRVAGGAEIALRCAGRTDALVHASGQVIHFDTNVERSMFTWVMGCNANLPSDISVTWAQAVPPHFDARFSAVARRYRYVIYNDPIRPAHMADELTWNHRPLEVDLMRQAASFLVGTHDFSAFRAKQCQAKSPIKTLHHIEVIRHNRFIVIDIRANAFLHHMVRNIAGVLMSIGAGEQPVEWMLNVLESRQRKMGGVTAHPYGLYLVRVEYPPEFDLPQRYLGPHFLADLADDLSSKS
ncbi:tRNA pseudouridine38-40 synthase [Azomonas agilis]|uniref:tRNA pseudouridine synthase A n=1 Tax=Azomonas agilis TaxID=116849 RepID=A0A562J176_9GAMM|nr:tRNA pseudouridine(38-40) synthase TruA [Azomonas agilis]TWH76555.1 tRNA pseudouridine38-40 synthase [Azomonas agilis]